MGRLEGKVCVITGAGGGMGREAALLFSDEGAQVCVAAEARQVPVGAEERLLDGVGRLVAIGNHAHHEREQHVLVAHDEVVEGVEISNAPDAPAHVRPTLVYEPVFFPWPRPLVLEAGDVVSLELKASLLHDEYVWAWKTQARRGNGETKGVFNQSTFLGTPLSLERFRRQARQ